MRLLFSFIAGRGHLEPMVPLARAAQAAGHDVLFASGTSTRPVLDSLRMPAVIVDHESSSRSAPETSGGYARRRPLASRHEKSRPTGPASPDRSVDDIKHDRAAGEHTRHHARRPNLDLGIDTLMAGSIDRFRDRFVERGARLRIHPLHRRCEDWRPDVVVAEESDFAAMLVAERLSIPYAQVLVMVCGTLVRPEFVGDAVLRLRGEIGLDADPTLEAPGRYLSLCPFPGVLRDSDYPLPPTASHFKGNRGVAKTGTQSERSDAQSDRGGARSDRENNASLKRIPEPLVYVTLGTVMNTESGDLFERIFNALAETSVRAIVTIGDDLDPNSLPKPPPSVTLLPFVQHAAVLPDCDAVVSHAGSGTLMDSLAHGLPSVFVPLGADQPINAERCSALGVGITLDATTATPGDVSDALRTILTEGSYRAAAQVIQSEIDELPTAEDALVRIEHLA